MTSDNVICRVRSYLPVCATPDAPIDMARRVYQEKMGVTLPRLSCGCGWVVNNISQCASPFLPIQSYKSPTHNFHDFLWKSNVLVVSIDLLMNDPQDFNIIEVGSRMVKLSLGTDLFNNKPFFSEDSPGSGQPTQEDTPVSKDGDGVASPVEEEMRAGRVDRSCARNDTTARQWAFNGSSHIVKRQSAVIPLDQLPIHQLS